MSEFSFAPPYNLTKSGLRTTTLIFLTWIFSWELIAAVCCLRLLSLDLLLAPDFGSLTTLDSLGGEDSRRLDGLQFFRRYFVLTRDYHIVARTLEASNSISQTPFGLQNLSVYFVFPLRRYYNYW